MLRSTTGTPAPPFLAIFRGRPREQLDAHGLDGVGPVSDARVGGAGRTARATTGKGEGGGGRGGGEVTCKHALVDPKEALLASVLHQSLTMVESDVQRLRHKNAKEGQSNTIDYKGKGLAMKW